MLLNETLGPDVRVRVQLQVPNACPHAEFESTAFMTDNPV